MRLRLSSVDLHIRSEGNSCNDILNSMSVQGMES